MLGDEKQEYLWSDSQLNLAANNAVTEACIRARLIYDTSSAISVLAGTAEYAIPTNIFYIQDFYSTVGGNYLAKGGVEDVIHKSWDTETGTPTRVILDYKAGWVRLQPIPILADTLNLTAAKTPLVPMESDDDEPAIESIHHIGLTLWMCHELYNRPDIDQAQRGESDRYLGLFTAQFGERPNVKVMNHQKRYRRHRVPGRYL